jgi:hypothetical protein
MPDGDDVVGYKSPPRATRYPAGVSGNPKGRPKRKDKGLPYARILDRKVTIKDGLGARPVTAEEAFFLYLRKKALDGNEVAQERLEEIQAFRREHDPDLDASDALTIVRIIVSPDNPNHVLRLRSTGLAAGAFSPRRSRVSKTSRTLRARRSPPSSWALRRRRCSKCPSTKPASIPKMILPGRRFRST